ncbi:hypothetical protein GPECTOR_15phG17 [Gonium pectorale]|uniref:Pherophorin domain-containing protein n=1 Tax=Gonium pectorale TaxID=33097 RepID=A0A150GLV9_GONPE|nr:hypothetical protein GPECTOR_15phG17 [Gonium pectorale]|eukprot:KXZ50846.1 hypothetical protein GPECTOR_15phG17 [Gonium pectorale]
MRSLRGVALLALLAGISVAVAQDDDLKAGTASGLPLFPYASCTKQLPRNIFSVDATVTNPSANTYCFTIRADRAQCTTGDVCCTNPTVNKFELDAKPVCDVFAQKVSATINGRPTPVGPAMYKPPAAADSQRTLRITQLNLTAAQAADAVICIKLCVAWVRTNGPVNKAACDLLASSISAAVTAQGESDLALPFTCSAMNSTTVTVCGDFKTESAARKIGSYMSSGGLGALAVPIGFDNIIVPQDGVMVCKKSLLTYWLTDMSGQVCDSASFATDCRPPQDAFPYCTCEPGVARRTPYTVSYTRKFVSSAGNNGYCFKIGVNQTQCGTSRCCGMDLQKIEWLTNKDNCFYAVDGWTVSTQPNIYKSAVWSRETDMVMQRGVETKVGVFKTNELNLVPANAAGVEVCITLKAKSKCPTLDTFCYGGVCKFAVFSKATNCCAKDYAPGVFGEYNRRR